MPQPIVRTGRAGTPATRVRGGTSAVTTLPAATNDCCPDADPGQDGHVRPQERAPLDHHRRRHRREAGLQRVVAVAHVRVGEDEDALGQGHLALEPHPFREVHEALVAQEALLPDRRGRRARAGRG